MKKELPIILCVVSGWIVLLDFFIPKPVIGTLSRAIVDWTLILSAASFVMGGMSVFAVNLARVRRRDSGARYRVVVLVCLAGMAGLGILGGIGEGTAYNWIFQNVQVPMESTMFSLLAFFIASAAFRAFRMRNAQATVLLLTAAVVMLGNVPLGGAIWSGLPSLSSWLLGHPSLAAQRGLIVGAAVGATATALRLIVGVERGYLGLRQ
jgi:hypothetical protein